ncbi:Gfo/Idh/MocA family oxidoreductase [Pseudomonas sp. Z1-14]|uniref:Gfo/Idh/MocA family protein n=1 Tax=Pseudomonas sp. Z1-14 TaxID=2817409 RepID=UPI003DA7B8FE
MKDPCVAFIGAGWVVRTIWAPLLAQQAARIVSIIDPHLPSREAFSDLPVAPRQHGCVSDKALEGCNLAFICSPNARHVSQAIRAMNKGLHVILEKPACLSANDAHALIEHSRQAGVEVLVTAAASHRSDVGAMLEAVARGDVGNLHCIDVSWRRRNGVPRPGSWFTRADQALAGSGADLGWHLLEVALQVLGYPLVDAALCNHVPAAPDEASREATWREDEDGNSTSAIDVESQSYSCLQTRGGALIRLSTAWASHQRQDETVITLYGSAGQLCLRTTFGFSQNRVKHPSLVLSVAGIDTPLGFADEENVAPYRQFLARRIALIGECAASRELEYRKLQSLASAMSAMYPHQSPPGGALHRQP